MAEEVRAKNLQSLLKFCLKADDGSKTVPTNAEDLKEKAEWFQKFVQETSINFGQKIRDDIAILSNAVSSKKINDTVMVALEELQDITEDVNFAKDFINMGGFEVVRQVIELDNPDVTIEAAQLIGNVIQNDELSQTSAVNAGLVEFLLSRISMSVDGCQTKRLVYALSCCIRGSASGLEKFRAGNGIKIVLDAMNVGNGEATAKCAFLLFCIISEDEKILLSEDELTEIISKAVNIGALSQEGMEHLLGLMKTALIRDKSLSRCFSAQSVVCLQNLLCDASGKEEFTDSMEHLTEILNNLK